MMSTFSVVASVSVVFWLTFGYVVVRMWRHGTTTDATYEPDPDDGCGCVELWEHLSERRGRSRSSDDRS